MPHDEDKSTIGERLTGVRDPKDPDGLLTVEQAENPPDPLAYGHEETDTLEKEQQRRASREREAGQRPRSVR
jgi:hypothetical protein